VVGLYEKLGFVKDPDGIKGMAFQRRKRAKNGALVPALSR
jgi:aralkylamine N-acetyltransferase